MNRVCCNCGERITGKDSVTWCDKCTPYAIPKRRKASIELLEADKDLVLAFDALSKLETAFISASHPDVAKDLFTKAGGALRQVRAAHQRRLELMGRRPT